MARSQRVTVRDCCCCTSYGLARPAETASWGAAENNICGPCSRRSPAACKTAHEKASGLFLMSYEAMVRDGRLRVTVPPATTAPAGGTP